MTLQELRNQAMLESGFIVQASAPEQVSELDNLLNLIQRQYGHKWKVPRFSDTQTGYAAQNYTLPAGVYTDGIFYVRIDSDNGKRIELLRREEADREYPDRSSWGTGQPVFVEYDVSNPGVLTFHPAPPTGGIDFTIFYARTPTAMEAHSDEPWDGQFPEFHYVIAKRAALHLAANRLSDLNREDAPVNTYTLLRGELKEAEAEIASALLDFGLIRWEDWWELGRI